MLSFPVTLQKNCARDSGIFKWFPCRIHHFTVRQTYRKHLKYPDKYGISSQWVSAKSPSPQPVHSTRKNCFPCKTKGNPRRGRRKSHTCVRQSKQGITLCEAKSKS